MSINANVQNHANTLPTPATTPTTTAPSVHTNAANPVLPNSPSAPLNGTYDGVGVPVSDPPVPPPVKFAPLGPIGRDSSVNWHAEDVQRHLAPIGSQKGVLQLAGRRARRGVPSTEAWGGFGLPGVGVSAGQPYYTKYISTLILECIGGRGLTQV